LNTLLSREDVQERAKSYAEKGYLCSEAVLLSLADCFGIQNDLIPKIATGFGAGIARSGMVCGAVSGAVIGLGIRFGRSTPGDTRSKRPYWFSKELVKAFKDEYQNLECPKLLKLDLDKEEEYKLYSERKYWATRCREYIITAAGLAYDIAAKEIDTNIP
jgi:C_GCAxxG_C_C family probable redox protein